MTVFDLFTLGIILLSATISTLRGAITEIMSILAWIIGLLVAKTFCVPFADNFLTSIQPRGIAIAVAFLIIFLIMWVIQHFTRSLITTLIKSIGLGFLNRVFGCILGLIKGIVVVTLVVLVCEFTDLPQTPEWRHAKTAPFFEYLITYTLPYLPPVLADSVQIQS